MIELVVICLCCLIVFIVVILEMSKAHKAQFDRILIEHRADMLEWKEERQQLLDRIQAPTFAEYKTAEVKVIKAQNGEKEPPKLEQL